MRHAVKVEGSETEQLHVLCGEYAGVVARALAKCAPCSVHAVGHEGQHTRGCEVRLWETLCKSGCATMAEVEGQSHACGLMR